MSVEKSESVALFFVHFMLSNHIPLYSTCLHFKSHFGML